MNGSQGDQFLEPKSPLSSTKLVQQSLGFSHGHSAQVISILSKPAESRSQKDVQLLLDNTQDNKCFNEIRQKVSFGFIKTILSKVEDIVHLEKGNILVLEGDKIQYVYLLVNGRIGMFKKEGLAESIGQVYEKLGLVASQEVKEINRLKKKNQSTKRKKPTARRASICLNQNFIESKINKRGLDSLQQNKEIVEICHVGLQDRSLGLKYVSTSFATEDSWLLRIPLQQFLTQLHYVFDKKVKAMLEKIKDLPCFKNQEQEKVETFILSLSQHTKKRGNYVYKQGDLADSIFLLTKGEIKLTKVSNLFVENPNNLYINRLKLFDLDEPGKAKARYEMLAMEEKKSEAILPYADLSSMFNYHPKKKTIEICRMESFCIFGEEEHIENIPRQTSAICNSLDIQYYEISMKKIEQIFGAKNMPAFLNDLKLSAKDKVLRRQFQYANSIHLQNQANMNYFYFDGEKDVVKPRKFRINKLNQILQDRSQTIQPRLNNAKFSTFTRPSGTVPTYTTFNFNKLAATDSHQNKYRKEAPLNSKSSHRQKFLNPEQKQLIQNFVEEDDDNCFQQYHSHPNKQQLKIMNITHTWKLIQNKVDAQLVQSVKLSPKKHRIDVNDPLIDNNFLTQLDKEKLRIEKKIRKDKITLGSSRVSSISVKNSGVKKQSKASFFNRFQ